MSTSDLTLERPAARAKHLRSIDPTDGREVATFSALDAAEVARRVDRAVEAFRSYRRTPFAERAAILNRVAQILEDEQDRWGTLLSEEMGKLKTAGVAEALKCARTCRFYADNGEAFLADRPVATSADQSFVAYQPLGPILGIMPWNFPFWQVVRFSAPALMAGNTVLLKHASNVPRCSLAIEEIYGRAGLPPGVFQALLVGSEGIQPVLADPRVAAVSLTGSDVAGAQVAAAAGGALKKLVMELGGSDPFIVMPSVDLDFAVEQAVAGRLVNNGQSCVAAKRFIVHQAIADEFERRFVARMGAIRVGNPLDANTELGPLATREGRDRLAEQVEQAVRDGARLLLGGNVLPGPGNFYAPTVLAEIPAHARARREELFGPVAMLFRASSLEDAIRIANDNPFGLGASLWSTDAKEHAVFLRDIEAGMAFVNTLVTSDPTLPAGGVKRSGYGRELGEIGIREFVNAKTCWIDSGGRASQFAGID